VQTVLVFKYHKSLKHFVFISYANVTQTA